MGREEGRGGERGGGKRVKYYITILNLGSRQRDWSASRPSLLFPGSSPPIPRAHESGWAPERLDASEKEKILHLPETKHQSSTA